MGICSPENFQQSTVSWVCFRRVEKGGGSRYIVCTVDNCNRDVLQPAVGPKKHFFQLFWKLYILPGPFHQIKLFPFRLLQRCELTTGSDEKTTGQPRRGSNVGLPITGRTLESLSYEATTGPASEFSIWTKLQVSVVSDKGQVVGPENFDASEAEDFTYHNPFLLICTDKATSAVTIRPINRFIDKAAINRIKISLFKVENNSLELTRILKENILTKSEREKKV